VLDALLMPSTAGTLTSHMTMLFWYCIQERQSITHHHLHNPPVPRCVVYHDC